MTVRERIRAYAESTGKPVSRRELTDALGVQGETVRRTLYRMTDSGDLVASGDGRYVLPDTGHNEHVSPPPKPDQDSERDTSKEMPAFTGIGVYTPEGMRPWRPKSG